MIFVKSYNVLINVILTLAISLISICACELIVRALPLSDRLGCNGVLPLSKRIEKFNLNAKIKIVCLGDSFLEWRAGEGTNMLDYVQKNLFAKNCAVLNLGRGGTDIDGYIASYNKYIHFKPDCIVMCVYLGNDVRNYVSYSDIDKIPVYDLDDFPKQKWKFFFKRHSILANLFFRFCKERIPFMRSGFFEHNIKILQKNNESLGSFIQTRIKQIDPQILKLAKSDAINPWIPAMGIAFPNYYKELFALRSQNAFGAAESTLTIIKEFYRKQGIKNFLVVFLPESLQVSKKYDYFFKKCGFILDDFTLQERRKLIKYLETKLNEAGIKTLDTTSALKKDSDVYINFDVHLNKRGHKIVGELITDFIKNNFLSNL